MNKKETIQIAVALTVFIGAIIGVNAHFAKASDLELVAMRLEQKIVSDASMQIEARKWQLLDRNTARDCSDIKNERDKDECRALEQKVRELDRKNQILMEKTAPGVK